MKKKIFLLLLTVTLLFTLIVSTFSVSTSALSREHTTVADTYSIDIDINDDGSTYLKRLVALDPFIEPFFTPNQNSIYLNEPTKSKLRDIVLGDMSAETDNLIYMVRLKNKNAIYKKYGYFDISYNTKDVNYGVSNSSYISMSTLFRSSVKQSGKTYDGASIEVTITTKMNDENNPYILERADGSRYYNVEIVFYSVPHTVNDYTELQNQNDNLLTENGKLQTQYDILNLENSRIEAELELLNDTYQQYISSAYCIYKTQELSEMGFATGEGNEFRLLSRKYQSGNDIIYRSATDEVLTLPLLSGELPIYDYDLDGLLKNALTSTEKRFLAIIYFYNYSTESYDALFNLPLYVGTEGKEYKFSSNGFEGNVIFSDSCRVLPPNGVGVGSLASWGISVDITNPSMDSPYNQGALKCKIGIVDSDASFAFQDEIQMLTKKNAEIQRVADTHEETLSNTTFMGSLFYGIAAGIAEFVSLIFGISFMGLSVGHLVAVAVIGFIVFFIISKIRS